MQGPLADKACALGSGCCRLLLPQCYSYCLPSLLPISRHMCLTGRAGWALQLAEQLHNILERTVGRSLDANPPSSSEDDEMEAEEGNGEGAALDAPVAAAAATVDVGVRMFKTVEEGTPCIFTPSTGKAPVGTGGPMPESFPRSICHGA